MVMVLCRLLERLLGRHPHRQRHCPVIVIVTIDALVQQTFLTNVIVIFQFQVTRCPDQRAGIGSAVLILMNRYVVRLHVPNQLLSNAIPICVRQSN